MSQSLTDTHEVARARRIFLLTSTAIYLDKALDAPMIRARLDARQGSAGEKGAK